MTTVEIGEGEGVGSGDAEGEGLGEGVTDGDGEGEGKGTGVGLGEGCDTETTVGEDRTPLAEATIIAVPEAEALSKPFWLIVATEGSLDSQLKSTPFSSSLFSPKARAENCSSSSGTKLAEVGETITLETPGAGGNGAPLVRVPGL